MLKTVPYDTEHKKFQHEISQVYYVIWSPWDQPKASQLSRGSSFQVSLCTEGLLWDLNYKCVDYVYVLIFKCPCTLIGL